MSLSSPNCSDAAIAQLVQLPVLEELRFPGYMTTLKRDGYVVMTSNRGSRMLGKAGKLRAIYYSPPDYYDDEDVPSTAALTSLFTLTYLVRITISAAWLTDGLPSGHRFEHFRCLRLIKQFAYNAVCPQTDAMLLPLVKPLDVLVDGRQQGQAARAAKRPVRSFRRQAAYQYSDADEDAEYSGEEEREEAVEAEDETEGTISAIPVNNAANFPALERLALPYNECNYGEDCGEVSGWMKRQLQRSYEYEVAAEWETECMILGVAELLKSIMACG